MEKYEIWERLVNTIKSIDENSSLVWLDTLFRNNRPGDVSMNVIATSLFDIIEKRNGIENENDAIVVVTEWSINSISTIISHMIRSDKVVRYLIDYFNAGEIYRDEENRYKVSHYSLLVVNQDWDLKSLVVDNMIDYRAKPAMSRHDFGNLCYNNSRRCGKSLADFIQKETSINYPLCGDDIKLALVNRVNYLEVEGIDG